MIVSVGTAGNPTTVQWYYPPEYNHAMLLDGIERLRRTRTWLVLLSETGIPKELTSLMESSYDKIAHVDQLDIYLIRPDSMVKFNEQ